MKKRQLTSYLSIFISLIMLGFTASAQVTNPKPATINFQDLLGKWKTVRIAADNFFQPPAPKPVVSPTDTSKKQAAPKPTADIRNMDRKSLVNLKNTAISMKNSILEFLPDKTATKTSGEKSEKYSWKTKKKNILLTKNLTTKEKTKMEVFKLNSDTLLVTQYLKNGNLYIFYLKVK